MSQVKNSAKIRVNKKEDGNKLPKKERLWTSEFKFRANRFWTKSSLPGKYKRLWVPETPPKKPTNNPYVDRLRKQPTAPESYQTCRPSKWKYGPQYRRGAYYSHGYPFVDKDGWFILWTLLRAFMLSKSIRSLDFETNFYDP